MMKIRYQVAHYSDGMWCIVDSTKFLDASARAANWPMQVRYSPITDRYVGTFDSRDEAQRAADDWNSLAALGVTLKGSGDE